MSRPACYCPAPVYLILWFLNTSLKEAEHLGCAGDKTIPRSFHLHRIRVLQHLVIDLMV